jgi:hypothetical protein
MIFFVEIEKVVENLRDWNIIKANVGFRYRSSQSTSYELIPAYALKDNYGNQIT